MGFCKSKFIGRSLLGRSEVEAEYGSENFPTSVANTSLPWEKSLFSPLLVVVASDGIYDQNGRDGCGC